MYLGAGEIAALDPETGRPVDGFSSDVHADIRALAVIGNRLYVGGNGLVALDAVTGDRDPTFKATPRDLADEAAFAGTVHVLAPDAGRLLAGGDFNALGGASGPLVALDPVTGRADRNFTPQVGTPAPSVSGEDQTIADRGVFDLARIGDVLWAGGLFDRAGGSPATNLAAINPSTGARLNVTPPILDGQVNALEPGAGRLYVGGQFFMAGYTSAPGFAAVDAATAALDPQFRPGSVCCGVLSATAGHVFLSRQHSHGYAPSVRPTKRNPRPLYYRKPDLSQIRAVDATTGALVAAFEKRTFRGIASVAVGGNELFVALRRDSRVRFPRNRIVVLDARDGSVKRRFNVPLKGYVAHMVVLRGSLYVAGSFRRFYSPDHPAHLAIIKLDPASGELDSAFDPHAHGPVYDVAPKSDSLYFTGLFDEVQGVERKGIAAVFPSLGGLNKAFAPPSGVHGTNVTNLTALTEDILFEGERRTLLLDGAPGAIDSDAAGGYAPAVDFAVATGGGIMYSATIDLPLGGSSVRSLSFVAPAAE